MKKQYFLFIYLIFLFCIGCSTDMDPSNLSNGIHIRLSVWKKIGGPNEYKFRDVPAYVGFITEFPWESIRAGLSEEVMDKIDIEYWIYTSIEDAELGMVERLDMSSLYMRNMIDFPLPGGEIGNNCWHQVEGGVIQFIRNNVLVLIKPPIFGDPFDWSDFELVARKIDAAIVNTKKVYIRALVPAPLIHSVDIVSGFPEDWGQPTKVKVISTDPKSQKLTYRQVGAGLALTNDNGVFKIMPDNSIPVYVCKDPNKFKIMIWVWNEDHLITLAKKEFSFKKEI